MMKFVCFFLSFVLSASAGVLYYDGFPLSGNGAYALGKLGTGVNPQHASIVGFKESSANQWRAGSTAIQIHDGSLSYPEGISLPTQEGALSVGEGSGSPRFAFRQVASPALSGTTYVSFLVQYAGAFPAKMTETFVSFGTYGIEGTKSGTSGDFVGTGVVIGFERQGSGASDPVALVLKADDQTVPLVAESEAGVTYFVGLRYEHAVGEPHVISASVLSSSVEPSVWDATITTLPRAVAPNKLCVGGYGANSKVNYFVLDEIRMGTTFQDVAGLAEGESVEFAGESTLSGLELDDADGARADLSVTLVKAGDPIAELVLCWGLTDGGNVSTSSWEHVNALGPASVGTQAFAFENLPLGSLVFYRIAAVTEQQTLWATPDPPCFLTAPIAVSSSGEVEENSRERASFTLTRPVAATNDAVTVHYTLGGTAVEGVDFEIESSSSAVIPAGASSVDVWVEPIPNFYDDAEPVLTLTVGSGAYLASAEAVASLTFRNVTLPEAPTNAFLGTFSDAASVAQNWALGHVPTAEECVLFSSDYARRNLLWDEESPRIIGSWMQPEGTDLSVVFQTRLESPLRILNDVRMEEGVWTHAGPSNAPVYALAVQVGGDFYVGEKAALNVGRDILAGMDRFGIARDVAGGSRGTYRGGPGFCMDTGASYGGEGFTNAVTYGSILNPLSYGSAGYGGGGAEALLKYAGPGIVAVCVEGETALYGHIAANGYGYGNNHGAASGGTVNLVTGSLVGEGTLSANGGNDAYYGSGSGGRIRVRLRSPQASFEDFTGTMSAFGGTGGAPGQQAQYDSAGAAAGTIALQLPAMNDTEARVFVANHNNWRAMTNEVARITPATHLPPVLSEDASLRQTDWVLGNSAIVRLTRNTAIRSIEFCAPTENAAASPMLFLDGHTLRVHALVVEGVKYAPGVYREADLPEGMCFDEGEIVVLSDATVVKVR